MGEEYHIKSREYWVKIVEMLQQNWALIEVHADSSVTVFFITDMSTIFDEMKFGSMEEAKEGLYRNGFERYGDDNTYRDFISPPQPPFSPHWDKTRKIYSSGEFWK